MARKAKSTTTSRIKGPFQMVPIYRNTGRAKIMSMKYLFEALRKNSDGCAEVVAIDELR